MEENKIDVYQIIGFLLLIAAIFWWFNVTIPDLEKSANAENQNNAQENQSEIIIEKDVLDLSDISTASNNETSIPFPFPVFSILYNACKIEACAFIPHAISHTETPTLPSSSSVSLCVLLHRLRLPLLIAL